MRQKQHQTFGVISELLFKLSKELTKVLKKQGMKFYTSHKVQSVDRAGDVVTVKAENAKGEIISIEDLSIGIYLIILFVYNSIFFVCDGLRLIIIYTHNAKNPMITIL